MKFQFSLNISKGDVQFILMFTDFYECRENYRRYEDRDEVHVIMTDSEGIILYNND